MVTAYCSRTSILLIFVVVCAIFILLFGTAGAAASVYVGVTELEKNDQFDQRTLTGVEKSLSPSGLSMQTAQEDGDTEQEGTNESAPPHENPEEVDNEGDSDRLQNYIESELSNRLIEATSNVEDRSYAETRQPLMNGYDEQLLRYENVAGEEMFELYINARIHHENFTETNQNFDEIRADYERAREAGNDQRARELARELEAEAELLLSSGDELVGSYDEIGDRTGQDHDDQTEVIETRQEEVASYIEQLNQDEFVQTQLLLSTERMQISFDSPAQIEGQLLTENDSPIANQSVTIAIGSLLYDVDTDEFGQFQLSHRPVLSPAGETELNVEYRPDSDSIYQTTNESVPIVVEQVNSTVLINDSSASVRFGDNVTADGLVVAGNDDRPVPGVSVSVFVDEQRLDTSTTDEDGQFSFSAPLSRSINAGDVELAVRIDNSDRAVAASDDEIPIRVESTDTELSIQADQTEEASESVTVRGAVESTYGVPIDNETVDVTVDGEPIESVTTGADGTFEQTIAVSEYTNDKNATIGATFDGSETNLGSSNDTVIISQLQEVEDTSVLPISAHDLLLLSGGTVVLFGTAAILWIRREPSSNVDERITIPNAISQSPRESSHYLLSEAENRLERGKNEDAVVLAYTAVRRRISRSEGLTDAATHWEFYKSYVNAGFDSVDKLEALIQIYERVTFASENADNANAVSAISAAKQVIVTIDRGNGDRGYR